MERDDHSRDTWTLSDGHAGNVRQVRALAAALDRADALDWHLHPRAPWRGASARPIAYRW